MNGFGPEEDAGVGSDHISVYGSTAAVFVLEGFFKEFILVIFEILDEVSDNEIAAEGDIIEVTDEGIIEAKGENGEVLGGEVKIFPLIKEGEGDGGLEGGDDDIWFRDGDDFKDIFDFEGVISVEIAEEFSVNGVEVVFNDGMGDMGVDII